MPRIAQRLNLVRPLALAAGQHDVFVCDGESDLHVVSFSQTPGALAPSPPIAAGCAGIDVGPAESSVYWTVSASASLDDRGVFRAAPGAPQAAPERVAALTYPSDVKVVGDVVLFTGSDDTGAPRVWRTDPPYNAASVPLPGLIGTRLVIGAGDRVFVAWPEQWNIATADGVSGQGARVLVDETPNDPGDPGPVPMAADASHLYFGMGGELRRVRLTANLPWETVAAAQGSVSGVTRHERWVYWLVSTPGELRRRDVDGGPVERVLDGLSSPGGLVGAEREMYWYESGDAAVVKALSWPDD